MSLGLIVAVFLAFPVQEMIPPIHSFLGARVLLVPALALYAGLALPFPAMVVVCSVAGFLSDLACLHVDAGQVEIGLGWSIVYFVIVGSLAHGFQPAFLRGHWWIHIPLAVVGTSLYLALQFAMISFRREGFVFGEVTMWRILGGGLLAGVASPLIHLVAWRVSSFFDNDAPVREASLTRP
ncbi:MAG: hypothetical protein Fur0032_10870 [Terrimicrobiaceae bacterium]